MTWTRATQRPLEGQRRALVRNDKGQEGFAPVLWLPGGPVLTGPVVRPHLDAHGLENGDSTTLDPYPTFA